MIPEQTENASHESSTAPHHADLTRLRVRVHLLEIENVRLRAALAQADAQLAEGRLSAERAALESQVRAVFGLPPEAPLHWHAVALWCAAAPAPVGVPPPVVGGQDG